MNFIEAVRTVSKGGMVKRACWPRRNLAKPRTPGASGIVIEEESNYSRTKMRTSWSPSIEDVLADDWQDIFEAHVHKYERCACGKKVEE